MDILKQLIDLEGELKAFLHAIHNNKEMVEDSYQDAYIKMDRYVKEGRIFHGNEASIKSLLKLACKNILLDKLRKDQRSKISYTDKTYDAIDWEMPDDYVIRAEQSIKDPDINKKLKKALKSMSPEIYMTYMLRMKGIKFKDIAYLTDTNINTALGRMRYAMLRVEGEFINGN